MTNQLLSVWSTIGSVLLAILILLAMITIHEFGHYLAGRIFKFKINEFSIGFGPAIFKRRSKKTGELFAIRIFPLGGYCAFAGEDGLEDENPEPKEPFPETEEPEAKSEPKEEDKSGYFTHRPCWQRIIVLVAGAFMNYLLALVLIMIGILSYGQTMVAVYESEPTEEIPAQFCLQDYDILLSIEGKNLYLTTDVAKALNGRKAGDRVKLVVSRAVNFQKEVDPATGEIRRSYDGRERQEVEIMLRSDVAVKNSADLSSVWKAIGIRNYGEGGESDYALASSVYRFGFFESIGRGFVYSFKIAGSIFKVLGELLTGKLGLSAFGGPVTTVTMTSEIVSRGFRYFLEIAGYIGVNLAVFNLLPIPALDGSKVIFTAIEWVRGKPVNRKVEAIIHAVGFILLLGFALLVDLLQFLM